MKDEYRALGSWGTLGLEIALSVMFGFLGGRWLDARFGTEPWISVVGFLFGCGAAAKAVHRTWTEMQKVTAREERERGNPAPIYDLPGDREPRRDEAHSSVEGGSPNGPSAPINTPEDDHERAP